MIRRTAPRHRLRGYSFHSVKGGVGKSTLAVATAVQAAQRWPDARVVLIDLDLTGTSLSDVLPLCAPRQATAGADFMSIDETRIAVANRDAEACDTCGPEGVRFLNDFILYAEPGLDTTYEPEPSSFGWRWDNGPDNLIVLPSSALPGDVSKIMPLVFDEQYGAFVESRLEHLVSRLLLAEPSVVVVVDVPPTVPGLSRAALSLGLRLRAEPVMSLVKRGGVSAAIESAERSWCPFLVSSTDIQDVVAAHRWWRRVEGEIPDAVQWVLNRAGSAGEPDAGVRLLQVIRERLGGAFMTEVDVEEANWMSVPDLEGLRFFGHGRDLPDLGEAGAAIDALLDCAP